MLNMCAHPVKSTATSGVCAVVEAGQHSNKGKWPSAHISQWRHADTADSHPGLDVCSGRWPNPCCAPSKHLHRRRSCAVCCSRLRQARMHELNLAAYTACTRRTAVQAVLMAGPVGGTHSRHDSHGRLVSRPHHHGASQRCIVGVPHRVGRQALDSLPNSACSRKATVCL